VDLPGFTYQFLQYVANNADPNIRTIDGKNTFHGIGMIATKTPEIFGASQSQR